MNEAEKHQKHLRINSLERVGIKFYSTEKRTNTKSIEGIYPDLQSEHIYF